jgi:anti-sigma regulatory factor (Ser/Thr protein kinase)
MRTGAAQGHTGYFHETAFYASDDDLLEVVVPFLEGGAAAGEPTLVAFAEANERLVRSALADTSGVTFLPGGSQYSRPAAAIKTYREMMARQVAAGARQIRIVGDVPHPGTGVAWEWWSRYEAAVNQAFNDFPLWGLCPYDTRTTPVEVLADVERTHPHIAARNDVHLRNPRYENTIELRHGHGEIDTLERSAPLAELVNMTPGGARHAALAACAGVGLSPLQVEDFVFATSEAVTNALVHGQPPSRLRLWADRTHVVASVTDRGAGPKDPLAGLLPTTNSSSAGLGLYISHLTCDYVSLSRDDDGFTIRIVVGRPGFVS